jgi:hypothetical protein
LESKSKAFGGPPRASLLDSNLVRRRAGTMIKALKDIRAVLAYATRLASENWDQQVSGDYQAFKFDGLIARARVEKYQGNAKQP